MKHILLAKKILDTQNFCKHSNGESALAPSKTTKDIGFSQIPRFQNHLCKLHERPWLRAIPHSSDINVCYKQTE